LIAKQKTFDEANLALSHAVSETAQDKLLSDIAGDNGFAAAEIQSIRNKIVQYQRERDALTTGDSQKSAAIDELAQTMGLPAPAPEPKAAPLPRALMGPKEEEEAQKAQDNMDFFTPITVEVSASSEKKHSSTEASSLSFGASASYGLFSASVSHEQSESHTKATAELANAAVKISMEVMRVDITRPWFRPELFYDDDLVCGPQVKISPGFGRLRALMDGDLNVGTKEQIEAELASYSILPLFPTCEFTHISKWTYADVLHSLHRRMQRRSRDIWQHFQP
jgi:flagellar motor switch/type III secretory pathway protein FliN